MPVYNVEHYVSEAISCILNQTWDSLELLILDDGSKDNTWNLVSKWKDPRIRLFRQRENLGYLKSANKLMQESHGDFITFQDADDTAEPTRIEKQVQALIANKNIVATACNYNLISKDKIQISKGISGIIDSDISTSILFNILGSSIMIRKEKLKEIGYFNPFFNRLGGEDLEWLLRIRRNGSIKVLEERLYNYRFNPSSVSNNIDDRRKLFVNDFLFYVDQKFKETGRNILEDSEHDKEKLFNILDSLITKESLSARFQQYGTRFIDRGFTAKSFNFILRSIIIYPFRLDNYKAFLYFLRKSLIF